MNVLEIESFKDPGYSGNMLKSSGLIFPFVELFTEDFFLFRGKIFFSIFGNEVREMFQKKTFFVEIILLLYKFECFSDLSRK